MRTCNNLAIGPMNGLDPINVIFLDDSLGMGRIIIQCYNRAWTAWWGSMSDRTVAEFFGDADTNYLVNNLLWGQKATKREFAYLARIVDTVKQVLKEPAVYAIT